MGKWQNRLGPSYYGYGAFSAPMTLKGDGDRDRHFLLRYLLRALGMRLPVFMPT